MIFDCSLLKYFIQIFRWKQKIIDYVHEYFSVKRNAYHLDDLIVQ